MIARQQVGRLLDLLALPAAGEGHARLVGAPVEGQVASIAGDLVAQVGQQDGLGELRERVSWPAGGSSGSSALPYR